MTNIGIYYMELRVGNWVYSTYEKNKEYQIKGFDIQALQEGMDPYVFNPIKVSDDVLLRFGFEALDVNEHQVEIDNGWKIIYQSCGYIYLKYNDLECEVSHFEYKYVHQIQNLYFALTGIELDMI